MDDVKAGTGSETSLEEERHASWIELFFDLVVVAGVGTLAHVIHDDVTGASLALYAVLFLAFWLSWMSYMLYGNAAGEDTRTVRLLMGMFGLAVMAASVPGVAEDVVHEGFQGAHFAMANAFAIAYVATRFAGAGAWRRGAVVADWPIAQHLTGVVPWVVSIWVDEPWKFALWALGIALDLVLLVVMSGEDMLGETQKRVDQMTQRSPERMTSFAGIQIVRFDAGHLSERLSLFVIIVLGEGVIQSVTAASEAEWGGPLLVTGFVAFVLLAGMWALSVVHGYAGVPHLRPDRVPQRFALALHCATTASIAAVAAALGGVVAHSGESLESPQRWLLCGAVATWFGLGTLANLVSSGLTLARPALWGTSGIAVPLLIGVAGDDLTGTAVVAYLALVVLVLIGVERRQQRADRPT